MEQVWFDFHKSFKERAKALVDAMTLEEKVSQLSYESKAIERLGIPAFIWNIDCDNGDSSEGVTTVFPKPIAMAASFNSELVFESATAISDEERASHHELKRLDGGSEKNGLTSCPINVNIVCVPTQKRSYETFGEDPHLTSRMGKEFCRGLQGDDKKYLKLAASIKHFAPNLKTETDEYKFNLAANIKDMKETYLAALEACVKDAGVRSVIFKYNIQNKETTRNDLTFLKKTLRDEWGFEGVALSDCGQLKEGSGKYDLTEIVAFFVKNGCGINCREITDKLFEAVEKGYITQDEINIAVYRVMLVRMELGEFDPDDIVPYATIPYETVGCNKHHELSKKMARESLVLLKNEKTLPLNKNKIKTIAVIGPNADNKSAFSQIFNGVASKCLTVLDGVKEIASDCKVIYAQGCSVSKNSKADFSEALAVAQEADAVILVLGMTPELENEVDERTDIKMPRIQEDLMEAVAAADKPMVLVNMTGNCMDFTKAEEKCGAIIQAWYPGQFGGLAVAEAIFGLFSPSGKLPTTFYRDISEIPDFNDSSMENRTYKFFRGRLMYPFGYGLSYGNIEYYKIMLQGEKIALGEDMPVSIHCFNNGNIDIKETVQVYLRDDDSSTRVPNYKLVDFKKIDLKAGEDKLVSFIVKAKDMEVITDEGENIIQPGTFCVYVGGSQPDMRSSQLLGYDPLAARFMVE